MDKTCTKCGQTKPRTEFWRKRAGRDGLQAACKACAEAAWNITVSRRPRYPAPEGMKRCSGCKEFKPTGDFCRNRRYVDSLHPRCKSCHYASEPAYRRSAEGSAKITAARHQRFAEPKTRAKYYDQKMRKKYGLPAEWTYAGMLKAQGGVCAICGATNNGPFHRFAIDHCHDSSRVRGLLCTCCNQAIGQLRHSPELLRNAIAYLNPET